MNLRPAALTTAPLVLAAAIAAAIASGATPAAAQIPAAGTVTFVESWPEQTVLDLPDLPDAPVLWPQVIGATQGRLDIASFYFSRKGDGKDAGGPEAAPDLLAPVLAEVARAAAERSVAVRVLADAGFAKTYPEVPQWLGGLPGVQARLLDLDEAHGGGILHAKYFLADDDLVYIGSQNWDWRALGQIHELGVLIRQPDLAAAARSIFEWDWGFAQGEDMPVTVPASAPLAEIPAHTLRTAAGAQVTGLIAASPPHALPAGVPWDLPLLVELIDSAQDSVHVQLLSFGETDREQRLFDDLDRALRRAAVRGAQVRMILANWSQTRHSLPWIQALAKIPGIEIRFTTIPEHAGGFIPFARVEHAKYLTVDGRACWIGTSNWSRDYFHDSRNLGLILLGEGAPRDPDRFFDLSWRGPYAEPVDPCGRYVAPRRQ